MTMTTKNEIFQEKLKTYLKANKAEKQQILDVVCSVTGMHRKAAVRKFSRLQLKDSRLQETRGRGGDIILKVLNLPFAQAYHLRV